jgi:general secretion pathway protein A
MYLEYYNLKEKPFQISTDPKFLWLGDKHKEAMSILKYGIIDNRGFLLLTGDVGTGKTTLINSLVSGLGNSTIVAVLPDPGLQHLDFYHFVAHAFKVEAKFKTKGEFLIAFGDFLNQAYDNDKRVLLIIDEAQRVTNKMLEEIRLLSNIEKQHTKLINIFFVGQNEFNELLIEPCNRALRQRITINYNIEPLSEKETGEYINFRLKVAGNPNSIFNPDAIREIITFSSGYPRLINIICDHALLTGYVKGAKQIDAKIIQECIKELQITSSESKIATKKIQHIKETGASTAGHTDRKPASRKSDYIIIALLILLFIFLYVMINKDQDIVISGKRHVILKEVVENDEPPLVVEDLREKPEKKVKELKKIIIHFDTNSNEFSEEAIQRIYSISEIANQHPEAEVVITGHTDSLGDKSYNKILSLFRANMVKSFMLGNGVSPLQLKTIGKGSEEPVATNETAAGRRANRRVEIEIFKK